MYNLYGMQTIDNPVAVTGGSGIANNTSAITLPGQVQISYPAQNQVLVYGALAYIAWRLLK